MKGIDVLKAINELDDELIDEAYMEQTATKKKKLRNTWLKWGGAAACLLCVGAVSIIAYQMQLPSYTGDETAMNTDTTAGEAVLTSEVPYVVLEDTQEECNLPTEETQQAFAEDCVSAGALVESSGSETSAAHNWEDYEIISSCPDGMAAILCYAQPKQGSYFLMQYLSDTIEKNEAADEQSLWAYQVRIVVFDYPGEAPEGEALSADSEKLREEYERLLAEGYDVTISEDLGLTGIFTAEELKDFSCNADYGYIIGFADEY